MDIKTLDDLYEEIKRIQELYEYYYDEEDQRIEELSIDGDLYHIPDLAVLQCWSNERPVIPIEIVGALINQLKKTMEPVDKWYFIKYLVKTTSLRDVTWKSYDHFEVITNKNPLEWYSEAIKSYREYAKKAEQGKEVEIVNWVEIPKEWALKYKDEFEFDYKNSKEED